MKTTSNIAMILISAVALSCMKRMATNEHFRFQKGSNPPIAIIHARTPFDGIITGGAPSLDELQQAKGLGFKMVVDLRTPGEGTSDEAARAKTLGLQYVSIPVKGADGLTVANAKALSTYTSDVSNLPMIVHCASGNRVGALFAIKAFHLDGKTVEEAIEVGKEAGLEGLEPQVRERLRQ